MSAASTEFDFGKVNRDDTVGGFTCTVTFNGQPLDITGAVLTCQFRDGAENARFDFDNDQKGGLNISDAINGVFQLLPWDLGKPPLGLLSYDVRMLLNGQRSTLVKGTLEVTTPETRVVE